MYELKTCPFCGKPARFEQTGYGTTDNASVRLPFQIRCVKCHATAPDAVGYIAINLNYEGKINTWHDDREAAAAAWNARPEK